MILRSRMRVLFLSDYVSIHQKAFCDAMYGALKENFTFMATTRVSEVRKQMGWSDYTKQVPYAVYNTDFTNEEIKKYVDGFDFIILGSSHEKRVNGILRKKLVFYYQERPLKKGARELLKPKRAWAILQMVLRQTKKTHLLAASAYCYADYSKLGCFKNRAWKWGYFIEPICKVYRPREGAVARILWVGRMIEWKHCEMMIESARVLQQNGYDFELDLIGGGEEEEELKTIVQKYKLTEKVNFLGKKSNEDVREYMKRADIFVATSDKREGWGVVVNEAMSAGCCVVASDAMGAAPFLIRQRGNGMLF